MNIEARAEELRREEANQPLCHWYLSFADKSGWHGGIFVLAQGFVTALDRVNALGINPGGEVFAMPIPCQIFPELTDKLLDRAQLEAAFGKLQKIRT